MIEIGAGPLIKNVSIGIYFLNAGLKFEPVEPGVRQRKYGGKKGTVLEYYWINNGYGPIVVMGIGIYTKLG